MSGLQLKYFVLNPNKRDRFGHASRVAMRAYARSIRKADHYLSDDLIEWAGIIEHKVGKENANARKIAELRSIRPKASRGR